MATTINPINKEYGRSLASLRRLTGMNQKDFGSSMGERFGDEYDWAQTTVSAIETGLRPLTVDEMEVLVVYFHERLEMDEEEVRRRIRPHRLRLVGEDQPLTSNPDNLATGGYPSPHPDLEDLSAAA